MGTTPLRNRAPQKTKRSEADKRAERILRLLVEQPLAHDTTTSLCPRCCDKCTFTDLVRVRPSVPTCPPCIRCGTPTVELNWAAVSCDLRRALRRDPELLARVKADAPAWRPSPNPAQERAPFVPKLSAPALSWLVTAWERAGKPKGRPTESERPYRVEFLVRATMLLAAAGRYPGCGKVRSRHSCHQAVKCLLGEASEHPGKYPELKGRRGRGELLDVRDVKRICAWVKRQREQPLSRLAGERLRRVAPAKHAGGRGERSKGGVLRLKE